MTRTPTDVRRSRAVAALAVLAMLAGLVVTQGLLVPAGAFNPVSSGGETFFADSFRTNNAANPTTYSPGNLNPGQMYEVTVDGTFSYWFANAMSDPSRVCGSPEPTALYPSPGTSNGPAGMDSETEFGYARYSGGSCGSLPVHFGGVQFDLGDGVFAHRPPVGGTLSSPRSDHTYRYVVKAAGSGQLGVRFADCCSLDNYGQLRVHVTPLSPGGIFVTGHDPDDHAAGSTAARHFLQKGIAYVNPKVSPKILLVSDARNPGGDQSDPRIGMTNSGLTYDVADYGSGTPGFLNLATLDFNSYDVIVVSSDYGGWLRQDEVNVLMNRKAALLDFVNAGGGLYVNSECGCRGISAPGVYPGVATNRYAFLPPLTPAAGGGGSATITADGAAATGLTAADSAGNNEHSHFTSTPSGWTLIDYLGSTSFVVTLGERGAYATASGLDTAAPTIDVTRTPAPNANGWNNTPVSLSFTCNDDLTGVSTCGPDAAFSSDTPAAGTAYTGYAVDGAGHVASTVINDIKVDLDKPSIAGAPESPSSNGWYGGDVVVHWSCVDALSGVASCPTDSVVTGEGMGLTVGGTATDNAGNSQSASSQPVNIDRTPPVTGYSAPSDWVNAPVTVTLSAVDNLDPQPTTHYSVDGGADDVGTEIAITSDGSHTIAFYSVDAAGNAEPSKTLAVKIDTQAPTITYSLSPAPNSNGWEHADSTVSFVCADQAELSGVASCTGDQLVTTEGASQPVVGTATDNAGNGASATAYVSIDKTPPTIDATATPAPNASGWNNTSVTVGYTCADQEGLSGIDVCPAAQTFTDGADQTASGTAVDLAGNTASASIAHIKVDTAPPTITGAVTTAPNANGWYKGDVTVHWTCADALSGVASCPTDSTITGAGTGLGSSATVFDLAGNSATATVTGINIDRTAPIVTTNSGTYTLGAVPSPSCTSTDSLSGVDANGCVVSALSGGQPNGVGDRTFTATSTDLAGNTTTVTGKFHVVYQWNGFSQPINDTGHTQNAGSVFKAGSTVPVKFTLTDANGNPVTAKSSPVWAVPQQGGSTSAALDPSAFGAPVSSRSVFVLDPTTDEYHLNWATSRSGGGTYWEIGVTLDDGETHTVVIALR